MRGTESGALKEWATLGQHASFLPRHPRSPPGPRASTQPRNGICRACSVSGDPHRLQHLGKTCDTVDVEHQPLGRREVGWTRSRGSQGGITAQLNDDLKPVRVIPARQVK